MRKTSVLLLIGLLLLALCAGCAAPAATDSGDADYEAMTIQIEGLRELDGGIAALSVAELRALPQQELDASYKRTTGLHEEFHMQGPLLRDVVALAGGDLDDYAGIGVIGRDSYYCLFSREVIDATPDLLLALVVDGEARLADDSAPARLAAQGQFGPYWVKQVEKIVLYEQIPEKEITSVWVFSALTAGIEPQAYEYYGSQDAAIDLEQVFSRLDYVDGQAFFTMKSADGFKKNEAMNMVKSRYYIKIDGADAPTNVAPYIQLGMNVQKIAWFSTNADAALFPALLVEYMDTKEVRGESGVPLDEVLYETGVEVVREAAFDLLGTNGERVRAAGADMNSGILVPLADGGAKVIWPEGSPYADIPSLQRIRLADDAAPEADGNGDSAKEADNDTENAEAAAGGAPEADDAVVLTIEGDALAAPATYTLAELQALSEGYLEQTFSTRNNWPTTGFCAGRGVSVSYLLRAAGVAEGAQSFRISSQDGYYAAFTASQLLGAQYCYPNIQSGSASGAYLVEPMLAWAYTEDSGDPVAAKTLDGLRLLVGQSGLHCVNTAASVQDAATITVSLAAGGQWDAPSFRMADGLLYLEHALMDQVKIYYTTDGSDPDESSAVYNPSTSYFQPELNKPLSLPPGMTVRAYAVGFGRADSAVAEFTVTE